MAKRDHDIVTKSQSVILIYQLGLLSWLDDFPQMYIKFFLTIGIFIFLFAVNFQGGHPIVPLSRPLSLWQKSLYGV